MANDDLFQTLELRPCSFGNLLFSPYELDYGTPEKHPSIDIRGLHIRLGNKPFAHNLWDMLQQRERELPPNLAVFDAYDIWLISHMIGVIRDRGHASVQRLGYIAEFEDEEQIYTIDLLPQSQFCTTTGGSFEFSTALGVEGCASMPDGIRSLLNKTKILAGDAKLEFTSELNLLGRISFSTLSTLIQAVGTGSSRCEWCFDADEKPLLGEQIMLQTVLVPRETKNIRFRICGYALIKTLWSPFGAKFETDWLSVECTLL